MGQYLRARTQANGIATDDPVAVTGEVPLPDGSKTEDDGEKHGRPEHEPHGIKEFSITFRPGVELCHP